MLQPNFSPFPTITTDNLILRKIDLTDAQALLFLRSSDEVMQYIDKEKMTSLDDAKKLIELITDGLTENNSICWAISLKVNPSELIGTIGFWKIQKEHYRAEIGYILHPNFWGKGIMQQAIAATIQYGFSNLNLHSIEANTNPLNTASQKLLQKNGFVQEAYFKENFYYNGQFLDSAIFSLIKK
jgi:[ribosomal protein S5]-alanine N-acetyltransferase